MPRVSVVLPTFNRANVIMRSVLSVLNQSYIDLELIVVDDCSNDNSREILTRVKDPRLKLVFLEENRGACHARNVGLKIANGKFVAFQDSGDEWLVDKLSSQICLLESNPGYKATCTSYLLISECGKANVIPSHSLSRLNVQVQDLLRCNVIGTPALVVETSFLRQLRGFDESLPRFQDWELAIRITKESPILFSSVPMVIAHSCENSITKNHESGIVAHEFIIKKHYNLFLKNKPILALNLRGLAISYFLSGNVMAATVNVVKSLKYAPTSWKSVIFLFFLLVPISCNFKIGLYRKLEKLRKSV